MSAEEYTEPFDLDRWVAGEPAYSSSSKRLLHFSHRNELAFVAKEPGANTTIGCKSNWRMKPRIDESTWIPHDGGECPIPWAKQYEYEVKSRGGTTAIMTHPAIEPGIWEHYVQYDYADVVAYRLTDKWFPIKGDGTIPEEIKAAQAGEWEYRLRDGRVEIPLGNIPINLSTCFSHKHPTNIDIVAVRLIKPIPKELADGLKEASKKGVGLARQLIENQRAISDPKEVQKRLTREASTRYFAKLHVVEKFTPSIGEMGIENAIFEALCREMKK